MLVIGLLAFVSAAIHPEQTTWWLVGAAVSMAAAILACALLVPWGRLPVWAYMLPPLASFLVIALLRDAQGGISSGYGPLAILPVVWVALVLGRRAVLTAVAGVALLFGLPIVLIGGASYPASSWRGLLLWTAVALLVGMVVTDVVAEQRRQSADAAQRAVELAQTQQALETVARIAREVAPGADSRSLICAVALESAGATIATVVEPTSDGSFQITGSAGIDIDLGELQRAVRPNASLRAFYARERTFIADISQAPGVSPLIAKTTGLVSVLYEPIIRHEQPVGVLGIGWSTRRDRLDTRTVTIASFLAAEAGAAIERTDLHTRLAVLARTDELTGIPNRRAWMQELNDLLEHKRPLCVAMLDLDRFKSYNDEHGHVAGDDLLRAAADSWTSVLRAGDLIGRYGGEEFAVILTDCTLSEAQLVLERMRGATPAMTCSVGVAEATPDDTATTLITRADNALYRAKRNGRNRLVAA